jgi:UDP-N-acetylglucosamine:LPS N-acetylglucosamine transferase
LNTNENKFEDMTNEVQVDEGVMARKRGHVATNKTLQLNLKGMQSTRMQIMIEHGENHNKKLEEKSTKLKVQRKTRKVLEFMSRNLC